MFMDNVTHYHLSGLDASSDRVGDDFTFFALDASGPESSSSASFLEADALSSIFRFLLALSFPRRSSLFHSSSRCVLRAGIFFISSLQWKHSNFSFKMGSYLLGFKSLT